MKASFGAFENDTALSVNNKQCSSHEKEEGKMEVEDEFGTTMVEEEQSELEVQSKQDERNTNHHYMMFLTDKVPSFYRRLHSSMDGIFTVFPCCKKMRLISFQFIYHLYYRITHRF